MAFSYDSPMPFWMAIPGYFDFEDVYDDLTKMLSNGDICAEVGCLLGRSACYWGAKIRESGKQVKLICVDLWPSAYHMSPPAGPWYESTYDTFRSNVRQSLLSDIIIPIRASSTVAATIVGGDLAAVFIDAEHTYEDCKSDILSWLPKIKKGGVIAGHDYSDTFPGVVKATQEIFGARVKTVSRQCWRVDL